MNKFKRLFLVALTVGILISAAALAADIYVASAGNRNIYSQTEDLSPAAAVLVPGAAVYRGGRMSDVFYDRAQVALEAYRAGKAPKILISGDHSRGDYDEVNTAKAFFLKNNVPGEDIFVDYAGFDTYDSVYRAKYIFRVESLIICTQEFHLPRALYLARELGIDASGIRADLHIYNLGFYNVLRENAARVKAFLDIATHAEPRYLGEQIPIAGDGRASWD